MTRVDENCVRDRKSVKKDRRIIINLVWTQERDEGVIRDGRDINRSEVAFVIIICPQSFRGYGLE